MAFTEPFTVPWIVRTAERVPVAAGVNDKITVQLPDGAIVPALAQVPPAVIA